MKKLFYKNSLSGILQLLINLLITFYVIHVFINKLGTEVYGVYSIISIIGNLNVLVNFGFNTCLLKYLSEQGKSLESNYDIIASILMMVIILIPFTIILFLLKKFILINIFNIPIYLYKESDIYMNFVLIANFIMLIGQLLTAILDSMQIIVITNLLQLGYNILYWAGIFIASILYESLATIGALNLVASIIWFVFVVFFVRNKWGKIIIKGFFNNLIRIIKKQLSYSLKIYLSSVTGLLIEPLSKIIISNLFSVKEVGFFDIALKIKSQIFNIIQKALYPLLPYLASLKEENRISTIIEDIEQKIYIIVVPLISIIFICSYSFVQLWIGENVQIITVSIQTLVCSFLIFSVTMIPVYFYFSLKYAIKTFYTQLISVIGNILIIIILYKFFGYYSILIGNSVAIVLSFLYLLYNQNKILNTSTFKSFILPLKLLVITLILSGSGIILNSIVSSHLLKLFINPTVIILMNIILYRMFSILKKSDFEKYFDDNNKIVKLVENILCIY